MVSEVSNRVGHGAPCPNPEIFRAYDIRGVVGETLTGAIVYWVGRALATEALGYILSQSALARGAIQEMLVSGGADVGPIARVETEFKIKVKAREGVKEKNARIDLVGFCEGDAKRALIEVKFWAGLTENQPNTYLDELLKNEEPSALLFVAPELRLNMLWTEVLRLANAGGFSLSETEGTPLPSAVVNGGPHRLMLTSWRTMLDEMSRKAGGDMTVVKDIEQLQALCDQQDRSAFLPLDAGEAGGNFSKRAVDVYNLYNGVVGRIKKEALVSFKGLAGSRLGANYGRYINLGNPSTGISDAAWVGVHYGFGTRYRETPFWMILGWGGGKPKTEEMRERLDAARQRDGLDYINTDFGKYPVSLIPIHLPTGVEYEVVLNSVVGQIRNIGEILAAPAP